MASFLVENSTLSSCENNPFYRPIYSIVAAVAAVSGFISLLACFFVIFIIILFKKFRFFTQRLVLYLAVVAALKASATILQRVDYNNQISPFYTSFCVFGAFFSQVTSWMLLNAIVAMMISMLVTSFRNKPPEKHEPLFLILIFVAPLTFNWIPFIHHAYGRAGPWCWIRSRDPVTCDRFLFGEVLQFVLFYVPLYLLLIVLMVLYVVVLVKVHRNRKKWTGKLNPGAETLRETTSRQILPLILFPFVFFVLYFPLLVNRIHGFVDPDNPAPVLWFIAAALFPLEGGGVAIVFTLDPRTRRRLTAASIKAAFSDFKRNSKVMEYPIQNVRTESQLNELLLNGSKVHAT